MRRRRGSRNWQRKVTRSFPIPLTRGKAFSFRGRFSITQEKDAELSSSFSPLAVCPIMWWGGESPKRSRKSIRTRRSCRWITIRTSACQYRKQIADAGHEYQKVKSTGGILSMKSFRKELHFHLPTRRGLVNITGDVQEAVT